MGDIVVFQPFVDSRNTYVRNDDGDATHNGSRI